jgi:hypothetical protein
MGRVARNVASEAGDRGSVFAWRYERLTASGFDRELAVQIAADGAADLHTLLGLVDRGCPPHLAWRIAAPLEREPRRP